jgi:cell division protein FtsB
MKSASASRGVDHGWMGVMNRAVRWCLFLGIIGFIVAQYVPLIQKNQMLRKSLAEWQESETRLAATHAAHQRRIRALREDPRTVERAARELLQLARPDESVVNFVNPAPASSPRSNGEVVR